MKVLYIIKAILTVLSKEPLVGFLYPNRFATLSRRTTPKKLGQLLINWQIISTGQLNKALELQGNGKKSFLLGEILVEMGIVKEEHITQALTTQYRLPYMPLDIYRINPKATQLIPEGIARKYKLIAIEKMGNCLTISMSNPLNYRAMQLVKDITQCSIQLLVSTSTEINKAIDKAYTN